MRLPVAEIPGRGSDELGNLVAVLELGTINLDRRARISEEALRQRFHGAGLAGPGRPQEQKRSDRPARTRHARQIRLVHTHDLADRLVLTHNPLAQVVQQRFGFTPHFLRFQQCSQATHPGSPFYPIRCAGRGFVVPVLEGLLDIYVNV
jgi:hypothetical protein